MEMFYIGQRTKPFTVDSPTFIQDKDQNVVRYYVEPGRAVIVPDADGEALLALDPGLWSKVAPPITAEEAAPLPPAELALIADTDAQADIKPTGRSRRT